LSARRAIAVREYVLANMAISSDRIRALGYGESRPIARNDTAAGRARNRRIDVVLELSGAS
jgi:OOP family OmpA-OmpF porin